MAQTINQNQQNVNINFDNLPVIEKPVYITKYRTVYVDRPQPKRVAKRLEKPVLLLGYLWVYPYDLGEFTRNPSGIINNINAQIPYDRNTWRVPDPDELAVMEANANQVGLGDDIYMDTSHRNGIVRLVSTGPTHSEMVAQEQAKRLKEEQERKKAYDREYIKTHEDGININGKIWATRNCDWDTSYDFSGAHGRGNYAVFAYSDEGGWFREPYEPRGRDISGIKLPEEWQLPSLKDFELLFQQGGIYDLENSCWRLGDFVLPATGSLWVNNQEYDSPQHHKQRREGRTEGCYLCSDGFFKFYLDSKSYYSRTYSNSFQSHDYSYYCYKIRLVRKGPYTHNKYFDK